MSVIKRAWGYGPFRWGAIIAGVTAATLLLLPGLHFGDYSANRFLPHATCYLRNPELIWLNVISDALIAAAYLTISGTLGYIVYKARHDIPFHWMFAAFGLFIVTCGFTHVMSVITVWRPYYWLAGDVKAITAVASVATAVVLPITVPRVFAMIRDAKVSEQRKIELVAAHEKLKESDELKSQFFANVSHELRTPLSLILGPIRRQLASADLTEEERRELEVVERNAGLLLQQVNNLLDLARIEARSMEPHYAPADLAQITRLVASNFDVLASEQGIAYEVATPQSLPAEVDSDKVQRVLLNLLSNAFKFTPEGGQIRCTLHEQGDEAVLVVEDSGPGIPEPLREAVLERFRQVEGGASRRVGGTGLGLSIVKEFVDLHGGTLVLGDSEAGGARIEVRLPRQAPAGAEVAEAERPSEEVAGQQAVDEIRTYRPAEPVAPEAEIDGRPLVLVVEDNPDMNDFVARTLGTRYRVATAFDGRDGLEQARDLLPDLIVSDIMMPHMTGDEMITALRADPDLREVPVIVLTAKADDDQRVHLLEEHVQDHITKPFQPDELMARASGLVRRRRETVEKLRAMNASLERRVQERTWQLQQQSDHLRRLAAELSATEQRERRKLAQVLHDHLQQMLVAARLGVEHASAISTPAASDLLARVSKTLDDSIAAARNVTLELYPPVLYDRGLAAALEWLGRHIQQQHWIEVQVHVDPAAEPADTDVQAFLFSAVQELLLNVVKHARSVRAHITMEKADDAVVIAVEDEGIGCNPETLLQSGQDQGFGLFNIRERLHVLGGHITIEVQQGHGCHIRIECPLSPGGHQQEGERA
jgi:signal transduction histidine kinase